MPYTPFKQISYLQHSYARIVHMTIMSPTFYTRIDITNSAVHNTVTFIFSHTAVMLVPTTFKQGIFPSPTTSGHIIQDFFKSSRINAIHVVIYRLSPYPNEFLRHTYYITIQHSCQDLK